MKKTVLIGHYLRSKCFERSIHKPGSKFNFFRFISGFGNNQMNSFGLTSLLEQPERSAEKLAHQCPGGKQSVNPIRKGEKALTIHQPAMFGKHWQAVHRKEERERKFLGIQRKQLLSKNFNSSRTFQSNLKMLPTTP